MTKGQLVSSIMAAIVATNSQNVLAKELGVKIRSSGLLSDLQDALEECSEQRLTELDAKYAPKKIEATNAKIDDVIGQIFGS